MDFDAAAISKFMENLSIKDSRIAGGLLWFLSCMDSDNSLYSASDSLFWGAAGGKMRGVSRQLLTESYQEYLKDVRRAKDRERQRKYREMSREKCDKCHAENVTKSVTLSHKNCDKTPDLSREMSRFTRDSLPSPSSPSPAPFLPPSPPTPPVTPYNPPNPNPNTPSSSSAAHAEPAATAAKPDFNTIEAYASANLDYLSPYNMQDLVAFAADLSDDLVRHAIDEACANGKRSWAYVRSILLRYQRAGFKTVGEVRADADRRSLQKTSSGRNNPALDYAQRSNAETSYSNCIIDLNSYSEEAAP